MTDDVEATADGDARARRHGRVRADGRRRERQLGDGQGSGRRDDRRLAARTSRRASRSTGEPGTPAWFELHTRAYEQTVAFYRDVFGWDAHAMSDTHEFRYTTLGEGESQLAGIMDDSPYSRATSRRTGRSTSP